MNRIQMGSQFSVKKKILSDRKGENMAPLKVEQYVVGPVQTNCYFAINDDTKEVLVIDPGASADQLARRFVRKS